MTFWARLKCMIRRRLSRFKKKQHAKEVCMDAPQNGGF